jgi:hypothetical protein
MKTPDKRKLTVAVVTLVASAGILALALSVDLPAPTAVGSNGGSAPRTPVVAAPAKPAATAAAAAAPAMAGAAAAGAEPSEQVKMQAEVTALVESCMRKPPCDERKLLMDQAALGFDRWLGKDHPRRADLMEVVGWSYDERQVLSAQFQAGVMNRTQLFERLSVHFGDMSRRFSSLLSREDYRKAFNSDPGVNPANLLGLTPEKARSLDQEKGG